MSVVPGIEAGADRLILGQGQTGLIVALIFPFVSINYLYPLNYTRSKQTMVIGSYSNGKFVVCVFLMAISS